MIFLKHIAKQIFQYEARLVLRRYHPKIIAITGSVGKTLTKDTLYAILSKKFFVRKSEKSFTTELGVPLSVIGCPYGSGSVLQWTQNILIGLRLLVFKSKYPDWLILEIDGDKPGDFLKLSSWLSPDILVVTAVGGVPAHIEEFGSDVEAFLNEKKSLIDSVSRDGVIIFNEDDEVTDRLVKGASARTISCGTTSDCAVSSKDFKILYSKTKNGQTVNGMSFEIFINGKSCPVTILSYLGEPIQNAVLLSVAAAKELGVSPEDSVAILGKLNFAPGRMNLVTGLKDTIIIDDSYNSSPIAMKQAVAVFSQIKNVGRKIAVIGDMFELGRFSAQEHVRIAQELHGVASYVICVGIRSRRIGEELLSLGFDESSLVCVDTSYEAGNILQNIIQAGDLILIKGSQAMRMERVVEEVMRHPEDKATVLCRQESEWLGRE